MPLSGLKHVDVPVHHVQMRRIQCEWCSTPHTVISHGEFTERVHGVLLVSDDEEMGRSALSWVAHRLRTVGEDPRRGVARCPSCNRAQRWMRWHAWAERGLLATVAGLVPGLLASMFVTGLFGLHVTGAVVCAVALAFTSAVGIGHQATRGRLVGPPGDARSRTDAELVDLLERCDEEDLDPALEWWFHELGNAPPGEDAMLFSLGLLDMSRTLDVPDVHSTAVRLDEFDEELG